MAYDNDQDVDKIEWLVHDIVADSNKNKIEYLTPSIRAR
jgi:hypothetical protein